MPERIGTIDVDEDLMHRLRRSRVHVEVPDDNCVILRRVPTSAGFFNKPHTNLIVTRPGEGAPLLVGVDEDLEYVGSDRALAQAFADAVHQQGWRVLLLPRAEVGIGEGLTDALHLVGYGDETPSSPPPVSVEPSAQPRAGMLGQHASELTAEAGGESVLGRDEVIRAVLSCVLARTPRLALVVGPAGGGKTAVIRGVAREAAARGRRLFRLDLGVVFAGTLFHSDRERRLAGAIAEAQELSAILALENLPAAIQEAPHGEQLLTSALERGVGLIGTALLVPQPLPAAFARHVEIMHLDEPGLPLVREILLAARAGLERHHALRIEDEAIEAVLEQAEAAAGTQPGRALGLLDVAATRAAVERAPAATRYHVYWATSGGT